MKIKLFDLKEQYKSIENEIKDAIAKVLESGIFILGTEVTSLEQEVAKYLGIKYAVAVASGTDALTLALISSGIKKGDEVITTPFTFIATIESIIHSGATPVLVDIDSDSCNINPKKIRDKINKKTKAILPVHMYGQSADMDEIMKIAKDHNLDVIEDAAQSFGAEYKNIKSGSLGDAGCFSFFPVKNFGAYGDAGMVVTNDEHKADKIKMLRVHGSEKKYIHEYIGFNSRLDALQATILRVKLKYIDKWNNMRTINASKYNKLLKEVNLITPVSKSFNKHTFHQYTIKVKNRDKCQEYLNKKGVATAIHYPFCIFDQKPFKYLNYTKEDFPVSYNISKEVLSLPMYPELPEEDINYVCSVLKNFFS